MVARPVRYGPVRQKKTFLQRLSEAEPLDGSFVRGAKTWAPRAGRPLTPIGGASAVHEHKQRARAKGA